MNGVSFDQIFARFRQLSSILPGGSSDFAINVTAEFESEASTFPD